MGRWCLSAAIQYFRTLHPLDFYDFEYVLDISEDNSIYGWQPQSLMSPDLTTVSFKKVNRDLTKYSANRADFSR